MTPGGVTSTSGLLVRGGNPVIKGHESLFERFVVEVAFDADLPASKAQVAVVGTAGGPALEFGREVVRVSRGGPGPLGCCREDDSTAFDQARSA
jgi:hypothetical protein